MDLELVVLDDTDYVLVKDERLEDAIAALRDARHSVSQTAR